MKSLCLSFFLKIIAISLKKNVNYKAHDNNQISNMSKSCRSAEGSAISMWSIKLVLSPLKPFYLIVSTIESLIQRILLVFDCSWIYGRFFSYEKKAHVFLLSCQISGDWKHRTVDLNVRGLKSPISAPTLKAASSW